MAKRARHYLKTPELTRYRSELQTTNCVVCGREIESPGGKAMPCGKATCQRRAQRQHDRLGYDGRRVPRKKP